MWAAFGQKDGRLSAAILRTLPLSICPNTLLHLAFCSALPGRCVCALGGRHTTSKCLPDINDIAIQYYSFWFDGFQVMQQFLGVAAIGTQVHIRQNQYIQFPFFYFIHYWIL
jgi:hypothetical protein